MELEYLKRISCTEYLTSIGFLKESKGNNIYSFFKSPFRNERTASFCINEARNTWFDYGAGLGGDIFKLVMLCQSVEFSQAIKVLKSSSLNTINVFKEAKPSVVITDVKKLNNNNLLNYLRFERHINCDLARCYVDEVHFEINNKKQYAIGFKNDMGGYELRNKYLKIATSPKCLTTIKGTDSINIFEGFIDFLSAVSYFNVKPTETVIILNSVSMINRLELSGPVKYWGDNDNAGNDCFGRLPLGSLDKRNLYQDHKDFNDFLCSRKK